MINDFYLFSEINVCNVLGGRFISLSQNLHWIYPKVYIHFFIKIIKFYFY